MPKYLFVPEDTDDPLFELWAGHDLMVNDEVRACDQVYLVTKLPPVTMGELTDPPTLPIVEVCRIS